MTNDDRMRYRDMLYTLILNEFDIRVYGLSKM